MADIGSPTPQPPSIAPATPPAPLVQLQVPPMQHNQPAQPPLNWSYFKPQISGKLEDDTEAHILRTNDWIETHNCPEAVKVQRFCLTVTGEVRQWYESLGSIRVEWQGLQDQFRQKYSKIGNTRKQLFRAWRPFPYDEYSEMLDTYVT